MKVFFKHTYFDIGVIYSVTNNQSVPISELLCYRSLFNQLFIVCISISVSRTSF